MYGSNITAKRYMAHSCQGRQGHKNYCYPSFIHFWGWFGGCEAVVYLMSPRRPTDIGLQLGKGQLSLRIADLCPTVSQYQLEFNDTSTLVGHFVLSPREREKRDTRDNKGYEREGQGRVRNVFISSVSLLFFHSCSSFFPVPLFHILYYLLYLFSPFLWETTKNDPQGFMCR